MRPVNDKVVVITGSSRGIGAAIAKLFAENGAKVVLNGRDEKALKKTAEKLAVADDRYAIVAADVATAKGMKSLVDGAYEKFGVVDVFINNAGVGSGGTIVETSEDDYDRTMDTNVKSIFFCFKELIPRMQEQEFGHIINVSSLAARNGLPNMAVYAASKAAVNVLSESVGGEVRNDNIKVSVLSPGSVDTNFGSGQSSRREAATRSGKKMLTPAEVAEAALSLAQQNENAWTSTADLRPLVVKRK